MATSTQSSTHACVLDSHQPRIVRFVTPDGDPGFATRFGRRYLGRDRWRGWELFGTNNRRAGAALVGSPGESIRVQILEEEF